MTLNLLLPLFNVKLRILICSIFELTRVSILLFEICYLLDIFVIVLIGLCCYWLREHVSRLCRMMHVLSLSLQEVFQNRMWLLWDLVLRLISLALMRSWWLHGRATQVMRKDIQNICLFLRVWPEVGVRESGRWSTDLTCLLIVGCIDVSFSSATLLKALEGTNVGLKCWFSLRKCRFREVAVLRDGFLTATSWSVL
jgi:hypothetical protein